MMKETLRLLLFLLLLILPLQAFALPTLSISSPGEDGVFVLRGDQMSGVAGFDVTVGYDAAALSNPRVTFGSLVAGMTSAANPGNPIRIAGTGLKAVSSSTGVIASIAFDRTGNAPGSITLLTGVLIDTASKTVSMGTPIITNPPPPSPDSTDNTGGNGQTGGNTGETDGKGSDGGTPGTGVVAPGSSGYTGGTITMPGQETTGQESATGQTTPTDDYSTTQETSRWTRGKKVQPGQGEQPIEREENSQMAPDEGATAPAPTGKQPQLAEPVRIESVLDRFRDFKGERTTASLVALLAPPPLASYTQTPRVVIADGKATVTLAITINVGDAPPRFSFGDCSYVSYSRTEKGWEIQARPDRGAVSASIALLYNGQRQEFPLVVAPAVQLAKSGQKSVTEDDFRRFLAGRGTEAAPRFDLNKDGKRDYVDDYIYTANYLVQTKQVK